MCPRGVRASGFLSSSYLPISGQQTPLLMVNVSPFLMTPQSGFQVGEVTLHHRHPSHSLSAEAAAIQLTVFHLTRAEELSDQGVS